MTTHDTTDTPDDDPRAHWRFTSGADWFTNWLSHIKAGRFDRDTRWCAQWWRHDEVVIRLEELWKAWETARLSEDPAALSSWWTAHLDAHWRTLTAENGPLYPELTTDMFIIWKKHQVFTPIAERFINELQKDSSNRKTCRY